MLNNNYLKLIVAISFTTATTTYATIETVNPSVIYASEQTNDHITQGHELKKSEKKWAIAGLIGQGIALVCAIPIIFLNKNAQENVPDALDDASLRNLSSSIASTSYSIFSYGIKELMTVAAISSFFCFHQTNQ